VGTELCRPLTGVLDGAEHMLWADGLDASIGLDAECALGRWT